MPSEPLKDILVDRITRDGPMDLATYMQVALSHPDHGYYSTRDSIGARGDFTTAPEISQLFGEMVGLWVIDCWQQMGSPASINLIEPGPGRGTLMADIVLTISHVSDMSPNIQLIETSPRLTDFQKGHLTAQWHTDFETVPAGPFILVANEFFDALPIHQFEMTEDGWAEAIVDVDPSSGRLVRRLRPCDTPKMTAGPASFEAAAAGDIVEICPAAETIMDNIAGRLRDDDGVALIFDYGYAVPAFGDSLQALYQGQYGDPFEHPGFADLTAHVNFSSLAAIAQGKGLSISGPLEQGAFLDQLGIQMRAGTLKRTVTQVQRTEIDLAVSRLTAPDQMGSLFKVLAVSSPGTLQPAGFAE